MNQAFENGNKRKAAYYAERILEENSDDWEAYYVLGAIEFDDENYEESLDNFYDCIHNVDTDDDEVVKFVYVEIIDYVATFDKDCRYFLDDDGCVNEVKVRFTSLIWALFECFDTFIENKNRDPWSDLIDIVVKDANENHVAFGICCDYIHNAVCTYPDIRDQLKIIKKGYNALKTLDPADDMELVLFLFKQAIELLNKALPNYSEDDLDEIAEYWCNNDIDGFSIHYDNAENEALKEVSFLGKRFAKKAITDNLKQYVEAYFNV